MKRCSSEKKWQSSYVKLMIPIWKWWYMIEVGEERWRIVNLVASKTMQIPGIKQREQPGKVMISAQTKHNLSARNVCDYLSNADLSISESFFDNNHLICEDCGKVCNSWFGLTRHLNVYQDPSPDKDHQKMKLAEYLDCHICGNVYKTLSDFKSHWYF